MVRFVLTTLALVLLVANPVLAADPSLTTVAQQKLTTEYLGLTATELRMSAAPAQAETPAANGAAALAEEGVVPRAGGALLAEADGVLFASPEGTFARLDVQDRTYRPNVLPALPDLGGASIVASKRYTYQELKPRVHGLASLRGAYYVTYDQYRAAEDRLYFVVAKLAPGAHAWKDVFRSPALDVGYYALGGGGAIRASAADGRIYFTVGDFSLDRINHLPSDLAPQVLNLPFGKVAYLDATDDSYHLFTSGHRNALGLVLLSDGRLLESENGPKGGDELNILTLGKNYGWPYASYGTHYGSYAPFNDGLTTPPGAIFEEPTYVFSPAIAPSQLLQVQNFDPRWDGNVLLGSLKAQTLYNIKLVGDRVQYCEPIVLNARIRDMVQTGSSFLLLTDTGTFVELKKTPSS